MPRRNVSARFFLTLSAATVVVVCATGCGGGLPLLHSVQALPPGRVSVGAGLSGQAALQSIPGGADLARNNQLQDSAIAPGVAPWVAARVGLAGSNEAGLSYNGRAIRLDGRHAFALNKKNSYALSAGLGGELLLLGRPRSGGQEPQSLLGGGFDIPLLFGWRSTAGLYSAWIGPRPGLTFVRGALADGTAFSLKDGRIGFVAGLSVGFRQVHVAMELGGAFHFVDATVNQTQQVEFTQFTLTPAGALVLSF